jgi:hypothetical protein
LQNANLKILLAEFGIENSDVFYSEAAKVVERYFIAEAKSKISNPRTVSCSRLDWQEKGL